MVCWNWFFWHEEFQRVGEEFDQNALFELSNFFCIPHLFHFQGSDCNPHRLGSSTHWNFILLLCLSALLQISDRSKKKFRLKLYRFQASAWVEQLKSMDSSQPKEVAKRCSHLNLLEFDQDLGFTNLSSTKADSKIQEWVILHLILPMSLISKLKLEKQRVYQVYRTFLPADFCSNLWKGLFW